MRTAEKVCTECGAHFLGGSNAKYCPACKPEAKRRYTREALRRRRAKFASEGRCLWCGYQKDTPNVLCSFCGKKNAISHTERAEERNRQELEQKLERLYTYTR